MRRNIMGKTRARLKMSRLDLREIKRRKIKMHTKTRRPRLLRGRINGSTHRCLRSS